MDIESSTMPAKRKVAPKRQARKPTARASQRQQRQRAPQQQQARRSPAQRTASAIVTDELKHEAKYLAGFVDPKLSSRGPGGCTRFGTHLSLLTGYQTLQIGQHEDTYDWEWGDALRYTMSSDGDVAIVVCPHVIVEPLGSAYTALGNTIAMGYTRDINTTLAHADSESSPYSTTNPTETASNAARKCPLENFAITFPGGYTGEATTWSNAETTHKRILTEPHRCVGLRATLTVNQPPLDCQGQVYGMDNMDFYHETQFTDIGGDIQSNRYTSTALVDGLIPNNYRRSKSCGSVVSGATYEATWIPTNDEAVKYKNYLPHGIPVSDTVLPMAPSNGNSVEFHLAHSPAVVFMLRGLNTSATASKLTATLAVTYAVEFAVDLKGPLSFLVRSAKSVPRYLSDWGQMQPVPCAGKSGDAAKAFMHSAYFLLCYQMRTGRMQVPKPVRESILGGAVPPDLPMAISPYAVDAFMKKYGVGYSGSR